jgi:hypothetical protein
MPWPSPPPPWPPPNNQQQRRPPGSHDREGIGNIERVSGEQCTRGLRVRVGWRWRRCGDGVPSRQGRRWLQTCGG